MIPPGRDFIWLKECTKRVQFRLRYRFAENVYSHHTDQTVIWCEVCAQEKLLVFCLQTSYLAAMLSVHFSVLGNLMKEIIWESECIEISRRFTISPFHLSVSILHQDRCGFVLFVVCVFWWFVLLSCLVLASFYEYAIAFFHELMDEHDWLHLSSKRSSYHCGLGIWHERHSPFDYMYLPRDWWKCHARLDPISLEVEAEQKSLLGSIQHSCMYVSPMESTWGWIGLDLTKWIKMVVWGILTGCGWTFWKLLAELAMHSFYCFGRLGSRPRAMLQANPYQ